MRITCYKQKGGGESDNDDQPFRNREVGLCYHGNGQTERGHRHWTGASSQIWEFVKMKERFLEIVKILYEKSYCIIRNFIVHFKIIWKKPYP